MNTKRNRWLAAALGLVALFYFGDLAYRKLYEEPRKASEDRKDKLAESLKRTKLDLAKAKQATEDLEGLESKSLPWDAERAQERYQDWLVQLAKDANLSNTRVDASNPVAVTGTDRATRRAYEMFKRFTFTISGSGDLTQVTRFLYDFYRGGHLQKITSLSLIPSSGDQLNLSMTVEALAAQRRPGSGIDHARVRRLGAGGRPRLSRHCAAEFLRPRRREFGVERDRIDGRHVQCPGELRKPGSPWVRPSEPKSCASANP